MISTLDDLNWLEACDWKTKQKIWHNRSKDLFPYLKSHLKHITKSPCSCIFMGRYLRTRVCKVCPTYCVLLKTMQATIFLERWVNPHVVASLKNWIHEIKRIWFFAAYEFNSIITLMFIKVSHLYLKWVGHYFWCLDITLILPNTCNQWLYLYIKHISNRVVKSWSWSCLLFYK